MNAKQRQINIKASLNYHKPRLPSNLLSEIISYLSLQTIQPLRRVSRDFRQRTVPNSYQEIIIDT